MKTKEQILKKVIEHRKADEIIKGKYWEMGKGCCIGCIAETSKNPHEVVAKLLFPKTDFKKALELCHLADRLFEGLPNGEAKLFPEKFVKSVDLEKDYRLVGHKFKLFVNEMNLKQVKRDSKKHPELKEVYEKTIPAIAAWSAAWSAWSAADSAADSAWSAAWSAAYTKMANRFLKLLSEV